MKRVSHVQVREGRQGHSRISRADLDDVAQDALDVSGADNAKPGYAGSLLAYHRSCADTLRAMLDELPLGPDARVVDVAAGDGTYSLVMAARGAHVCAVDQNEEYLELARLRAVTRSLHFETRCADVRALPFSDAELDGAFCAQSFFDIKDVRQVLEEMRRVVRPGGWVAVMENDSLHHVVLPWPPGLEVRLRAAQHEVLSQEPLGESRYYIGRQLTPVLQSIALTDVKKSCFATQKNAPLSQDDRSFLGQHMDELIELARPCLTESEYLDIKQLCTPSHERFLLNAPGFSATILDFLVWGKVPGNLHTAASSQPAPDPAAGPADGIVSGTGSEGGGSVAS